MYLLKVVPMTNIVLLLSGAWCLICSYVDRDLYLLPCVEMKSRLCRCAQAGLR